MYYAVARYEHGHGVLRYRRGHGSHGLGLANPLCHFLVAHRGAERNLAQFGPHLQLKLGAFHVKVHGVVQSFEDDALNRVGHDVALRGGRVLSPSFCQFMDGLQPVVF